MLKSTYKGQANTGAPPPLPPGWTEHTAPTGHKYYYHPETEQSTYTRPGLPIAPSQPAPVDASSNFYRPSALPNLSDPNVANAYLAQFNTQHRPAQGHHRGGHGHGGRGGGDHRPRPQPVDKPKSKVAIPGCDPWILVSTKYGRRFAYNPDKNASYWRIPEKLKAGILELDQARIREKAAPETAVKQEKQEASEGNAAPGASNRPGGGSAAPVGPEGDPADDSSEYEEVEVTDDEADDGNAEPADGDEHPSKRQRTEESADEDEGVVEFSEADIAFQLQAMGEEYGLDPGEYDDGNMEEWPEGADGVAFSEEDARALFKDLLDDFHINPYNTWEKIIEDGRIFDDPRYTVLDTMKTRKEVWQEWSKDRIRGIKEQRAKEEKKDPRIPYMALLQEKATPKLFWPEFKRKFRKEPAIADPYLKDKDREKWYREHIQRLKLPQATLKTDLATLLKTAPLSALNNKTSLSRLPAQVLIDARYISLPPAVRDPLIETYIQTLGPPPEGENAAEEDEASQKAREAKQRREKALRDHEQRVAEEKRRQQKSLEMGRARLREEERELERAMQVGKQGLQSQLATLQTKDSEGDA